MSKQLTIRDVPDKVRQRLESLSRSLGQSLNATVLELLEPAVGVAERRQRLARYTTWTREDLEEFNEVLAVQRTRYLLDTNVLSETARTKPDPKVMHWIGQLASVSLPAVTVYEIAAGIHRLPTGEKREFLERWFAEFLTAGCEVLPFDEEAALCCADLESQARARRQTVEIRDLFILAIAKARGMGVATRNIAHFQGFGVPLYDPFSEAHFT